jgi:chloramphenicol O-acetyltransferase type A
MESKPRSKLIDLKSYKRARLFDYFNQFEVPFTSFTVNVEIGDFFEKCRSRRYRFFSSLCLAITKSSNQIPEFRHRVVGEGLVEFESVYPAVTVLDQDNVLSFAKGIYSGDFDPDYRVLVQAIDRAKMGLDQEGDEEQPYQIFVSNIPWISFTSVTHPYFSKNKSIPIFTVGKLIEGENGKTIPIAVQSNHALVDGFHIAKFYENLIENVQDFSRDSR